MRHLLTFAFCLLTGLQLIAGGGPDGYGYTWKGSDDAGGPVYNWIDITGIGQPLGASDDEGSIDNVQIGFTFHYYWSNYTEVRLGYNGWLGFSPAGNLGHCFDEIPQTGSQIDNYLAPFATDLSFFSGYPTQPNPGEIYTWSNGQDTFIVSYLNVPWWKDDLGGSAPPDWEGDNSFQIILCGTDSSITFQYLHTDDSAFIDYSFCDQDLEIGIENLTGTMGLQVFHEVMPPDSYAVKFYYPDSVLAEVADATPRWNDNESNRARFFWAGDTLSMLTFIANVGNTALSGMVSASGNLTHAPSTSNIWSGFEVMTGPAAGQGDSLVFTLPANPQLPGPYTFEVQTTSAADMNPFNNRRKVELVAVDCDSSAYQLSYAYEGPPTGIISWQGGGGNGAGVYMRPPGHPAVLESVDLYILGYDTGPSPLPSGFRLRIRADSAGLPGAVLRDTLIAAADAIKNDWNRVVLDSALSIVSGGFFIEWLMDGDSIGLGVISDGPFSRQNYEVFNGQWLSYRNNESEDLLVRANMAGQCPITGRDDALQARLRAWPNPTDGVLHVELPATAGDFWTIGLWDPSGRMVGLHDVRSGQQEIDLSSLPAGIYLLRARSRDSEETMRISVQR